MTMHTLVAIVEDHPGVLARVASLFRRRGFNIQSLAVGPTEMPGLSRMTIVVDGATVAVEQVRKQLAKIMEVIKVSDISRQRLVAKELALIKVRTTPTTRGEIIRAADVSGARIVDAAGDSITMEITEDSEKIDSLITLLRGFGIKEVARTGRVAMTRGAEAVLQAGAETGPARGRRRGPPAVPETYKERS
ncbi:MAG TPA: acetolactate synthase small subunit [Dehalococcoidia bacterium]|jgi:acetolactate synthase-1/3 small subunit|nr:acetolactate synthase small subunit [Dehalococcoidia bacterium]